MTVAAGRESYFVGRCAADFKKSRLAIVRAKGVGDEGTEMARYSIGHNRVLTALLVWVGLLLFPGGWGLQEGLAQGILPSYGTPVSELGASSAQQPGRLPPGQVPPSTLSVPLGGETPVQFQGESIPKGIGILSGFEVENPRGQAGSVLAVEEVQPSVYWLPGESGKLQPVINIPFEVFEKIRSQLQAGTQPPPYTLVRFAFDGFVDGNRGELRVELEAYVAGGSWTAIPLALDSGAVVAESVTYEGPGRYFLAFDDRKGYLWWVRAESDASHRLLFRVLVPVNRSKDGAELRLFTPQATSAMGRVEVAEPGVTFEVAEGLQVLTSSSGENSSWIEVVGVGGYLGRGGQMIIKWRQKPSIGAPEKLARLDVTARHYVRLLTEQLLTTAELQLRPLGAAVEQAEILLPPGAEIIPGEAAGQYQVIPVSERETTPSLPVVRVVFTEPVRNGTTVTISWRQILGSPGEPILLGVRAVRQAARHAGVVVVSSSSWRACQWEFSGDIRRVDTQALGETLRKTDELLGAFEYYSEGYELRMRCAPENTQVVAAPEYELVIGADYARLVARWRLYVRGMPVPAIEVHTGGWQIEQVEPESLFSPEMVLSEFSESASLRLAQPLLGPGEVAITARRKLDASSGKVKLGLVIPKVDILAAGPLTVRCEENVEILFDMAESTGLRRQTRPTGPELSWPLVRGYFRMEPATGSSPVLVFDRWVHRQEVTISSDATVTLRSGLGTVEQRIEYQIAYQPLHHLTFALPESVTRSNGVEFFLDGQRVSPLRVGSEAPGGGEGVVRRLVLPEPKLGRLELVFRASLALPYLPPRASVALTVPLIVPQEGVWRQNRVRLLLEEGVRVQPRAGVWQGAMDSFGWIDGPEVLLYADEGVPELQVVVHRPGGRGIVVERAWIQTFLGARTRQDWVVFRLVTAEPDIELQLPPGADPEEAWAAVAIGSPENVQKIRTEVTPAGALQVFLPEHQAHQPVYLELVYRLGGQLRQLRSIPIALPQIRGDVWMHQAYWQLILPSQWHLVQQPSEWVPEHRLSFRRGLLVREPSVDEVALALWAGAIHPRKIPEKAEVYLFSKQDSLGPVEVVLLRRPTIVLGASGVVLLTGLAMLYLPILRRPAVLWFLTVVVAGASVVNPESALLVAQASILGFVLVGVAVFLRRTVVVSSSVAELASYVATFSSEPPENGVVSAGASLTARRGVSPASSSVYK